MYQYPRNLDLNSGTTIGVGISPNSYANGLRTTSATAHLANLPGNLAVWEYSPVNKLLFNGKQAVGVELRDGRQGELTSSLNLDTKLLMTFGRPKP